VGEGVKLGLCGGLLRWAYVGNSVNLGLYGGQC